MTYSDDQEQRTEKDYRNEIEENESSSSPIKRRSENSKASDKLKTNKVRGFQKIKPSKSNKQAREMDNNGEVPYVLSNNIESGSKISRSDSRSNADVKNEKSNLIKSADFRNHSKLDIYPNVKSIVAKRRVPITDKKPDIYSKKDTSNLDALKEVASHYHESDFIEENTRFSRENVLQLPLRPVMILPRPQINYRPPNSPMHSKVYRYESFKKWLDDHAMHIRNHNDLPDEAFVEDPDGNGFCCPRPGCDVILGDVSRIKRHFITHTIIKPYKCTNRGCNKMFNRKDNRDTHSKDNCSYFKYGN